MRSVSRRDFVTMLAGIPFLTVATRATAQRNSLSRNQIEAVEAILRKLVDSNAVPGISYSIGNASETLAEGAFGLRVVDPRTPMESETRCALASVSKQFVAAGAYLLQQKGVLNLDAPLSNYLPDYVHAHEMTLSQVLTMRSGISMDDEACEKAIDAKIDDSTLIANLNKLKLDFPPGAHFAYSNCAYNVAGVVIARVSMMSYAQFIDENFFRPLAMASSYPLGGRDESNFAQGYSKEARGWKLEPATPADKAFASGNLVSTPGDMQRWNRSLLKATILSRNTLKKIFTVPSAHTHYASGWFVEPSGAIWHAGTLAGYGTNNMLVPATGYAITLLSNTPQNEHWKPADTSVEIYNAAALGPKLPPLLKRVRTSAPHAQP
ncbi:MAG TPA: serine hydrolase domain-containing protein [Candidatus Acidoferrales bacterium]|nr:serine hydrolase domain-containing protein [Candidatus Acidoferrales bacterium]